LDEQSKNIALALVNKEVYGIEPALIAVGYLGKGHYLFSILLFEALNVRLDFFLGFF
jgi:hypothetical protein